MCNRFRATSSLSTLLEHFQAWDEIEDYRPRFNIAPTQPVLVVRQDGDKRKLSPMRWGLIPHWATGITSGNFNARSERVTTTPSFSDAIVSRRCLVPADGFYEWQQMGSVKQPYCFEVGHGDLFGFAGLWDEWNGKKSCAILTTAANPLVAEIHDRMPVILNPEKYDIWLNSQTLEDALGLLESYDAARMRKYPVSTRLNDAKNDDREVAAPVELNVPKQALLFG
jgi:putative SOS response-associated peptidase YedK